MRRAGISWVLALGLAVAGAAGADTLELVKGETLAGKLKLFADDVLHFKTKLAGNVIVPADEIVRLQTDAPVAITQNDGTLLRGRISLDQKGVLIDGRQQPIPLDAIKHIKPAPGDDKTRVSAETGVLYRFGDDDYADAFGRIALSTELDRYLFTSNLFVERADADEFPRWLTAGARLRFHPDHLWQPAIGLDFERDTDKALRSRAGLNFGLVRTFPNLGLDAEAGLQVETTRWQNEPTEENLNLRLALRYTRQVFENGEFTNSLSFTPSLTHPDRLRATSQTSLAFPFAQRARIKLNLLVDYEDYPQLDLPNLRTTVGASFLWDF